MGEANTCRMTHSRTQHRTLSPGSCSSIPDLIEIAPCCKHGQRCAPATIQCVKRLANHLDRAGKHQRAKEVRKNAGRTVRVGTEGASTTSATCSNCRRQEGPDEVASFKKCNRCMVARYCSRECQKAHWSSQHQCVAARTA